MSKAPSPLQVKMCWANPAYWLALGFGTGLAPKAPGTVASAVAVSLHWLLLENLPIYVRVGVIVLGFALGCIAISIVEREMHNHDDGAIVWDEFIGVWVALLPAEPGLVNAAIGFLLFRLFDIWKPWPISWADRQVPGSVGVMLDDVLAGIAAAAFLVAIDLGLFAELTG